MDQLLNKINHLFAQGCATEFEIRLLEKEASFFITQSTTAAEGYMALGLLAGLKLDYEAANTFFSKGLLLAPTDGLLFSNYAKVQHALGHSIKALASIERAMEWIDHEVLISQAIHIALSALQFEKALEWQKRLKKPITSVSDAWLNNHVNLLKSFGVSPEEMTQYRDKMASVLIQEGILADKGWVGFRPDGSIEYIFAIVDSTFNTESIEKQWVGMVDEKLANIVVFYSFLEEDITDRKSAS